MLLYNLIGYFAAFHLIKSEWRSYVHKQLFHLAGEKSMITFAFSKQEFDISQGEFVKNSRFYDVVKYEIVGDSLKIYCFDDSTETQLVSQFQDVLLENSPQKSDFQGKTQLLLKQLVQEYIFETPFSLKCTPSVFSAIFNDFVYKNRFIAAPFLQLDSPPPQVILI